jgi:predicted TIM-barrel fold metal-dependent hydrolase
LIDVHMHFLPECYRDALARAGMGTLDGGMPVPTWSEELALRTMDDLGIEVAMLSVSSPSIRFVSGDAERTLCRQINLAGAELLRRRPDRFGFFATLPLPDPEAALPELAFAIDELGADGIVLDSNVRGIYLGDERFGPVFDELNRRETVVFMHPTSPACFASIALGRPAPLIEFPIDTTRTVVDLLYNGVFRRCPKLKFIVPHGGGALPTLAPRIAAFANRPTLKPKPQDSREVFETLSSLYYDIVQSAHPAPFGALRQIAPVSQLLFGSDWPFARPEGVQANLGELQRSDLSEPERSRICCGNAYRLFPRLARRAQLRSLSGGD